MARLHRFGRFELDESEHVVRVRGGDGRPVGSLMLARKSFDTLRYLVSRPGRIVTRDELLGSLWADTPVEEGNLSWTMSAVRKALAREGAQGLIETVRGRGYRFVAPVDVLEARPERPAPADSGMAASSRARPAPTAGRTRFRLGRLLGLALLATLLLPTMATVLAGRSRGSNGRPVCAIGALRDLSDRADSAWLGEALREMLAAELARDALQAMSDDDAARQGAVCLAGSYLALGGREGRVRIDLMLRARRAGDTATLTRVGRRQDLPALVASLAEDVRETLGLPSDGSSGEAARLALSSYVAAGRQPPEPSPPPPAVP